MEEKTIIIISPIIDGINTLTRICFCDNFKRVKEYNEASPSDDFTILIPTYNSKGHIEDVLSKMEKYRDKIIVVDDASRDDTAEIVKNLGFRVIVNPQNGKKVGAIKYALPHIETSYIIVLDSDTWIPETENVHQLTGYVKDNNLSGCAVKVLPKPENILTSLQYIEYAKSMTIGRGSMGDHVHCVSGAFGIFNTDDLREVTEKQVERGTIWEGEDFERTLRILGNEGRVSYLDNFTIETDSPKNLKNLTKQRVMWKKGYLRCHLDFIRTSFNNRRLGLTFMFNLLINIFLHPLKLIYIPQLRWIILFYLCYVYLEFLATVVSLPKERKYLKYVPLLPLYNLYNVTVPTTIGYIEEIIDRFT